MLVAVGVRVGVGGIPVTVGVRVGVGGRGVAVAPGGSGGGVEVIILGKYTTWMRAAVWALNS